MKIFYFTTTGNSLAVARAIGGELISINNVLTGQCHSWCGEEAVGVVCPVYFGKLPEPVADFLSTSVLESPYRFLVLTCGSTPAFAVRCCRGWDYVRSIRMVDNYFPMFDVEKQIETLPAKRVGGNLEEIVADISCRRVYREGVSVYGRIAGWYMRLFGLSPKAYMRFYVDDGCNGCGVCKKVCPIGNIAMRHGRPVIGSGCLTCGACYHNCPSGAIRYRGEKSRVQYRHRGVSLADIIGASRRN